MTEPITPDNLEENKLLIEKTEDVTTIKVPLPVVPLPEVHLPEVPLPEVPLPEVPLPEVPLPDVFEPVVTEDIVLKQTILLLLKSLLNDKKDEFSKYGLTVSPEVKNWLQILCDNSPDFFNDIETTFARIIADDKIDVKDIPDFLDLVAKIYKCVEEQKANIKNIDLYELAKIVLRLFLSLYIEINNIKNTELLLTMEKIVEVSIELIKIRNIKVTKMNILNCCK